MNILQVMGCTSDQYASMERYLVRKAGFCKDRNHGFWVAYESIPASEEFIQDLQDNSGVLLELRSSGKLDWEFYRRLYHAIKENHIEVVHAYFTPTCHYAMVASMFIGVKKRFRTSANLPYTLFKTGPKTSRYAETVFKLTQRALALFTHCIVCRSTGIQEEFVQMGIPAHKLAVASGGTDTGLYRKDAKLKNRLRGIHQIQVHCKVIGTACRLVPVKGLEVFIQAAERLVRTRDNLLFLIIGDGPQRDELSSLIQRLRMEKYVKLMGHCNDLPDLLNLLDIFVSSSYSEGMSNSILEAMSSEVPIVVSDIAPNREIFEIAEKSKCDIGERFETGSAESLAEKISLLLAKDGWEDMGRNARKIVEDHFSLDARIEKEFFVYDQNL